MTQSYAPDGLHIQVRSNVGMAHQPYSTNQRSKLDSQPLLTGNGNMLAFDGRLDNYDELGKQLDLCGPDTSDGRIALAAFDRWGSGCFARFVGDWALALWSNADRALYLARDHAGTRTLYYERNTERILWSTQLESFFPDSTTRPLNRSYAAAYLTGRPLLDRTPYHDIRAVPPAHYLVLRGSMAHRHPYWQPIIDERVLYRSEQTYDENFLDLFSRSVKRRTGPGAPVLAELSGGMDSTSIVCISDKLRFPHSNGLSGGLLDTVSFYDDAEPAWNEQAYFTAVEKHRGKVGVHVDLSRAAFTFETAHLPSGPQLLPGTDSGTWRFQHELDQQLGDAHRAILSGIGGDELLGGVPSGLPELADLLASGELRALLSRSIRWCLVDRSPLLYMLFNTVRFKANLCRQRSPQPTAQPAWVPKSILRLCEAAAPLDRALGCRRHLSPSTIYNATTWHFLLESLPHLFPSSSIRREYRYPFLDRELVEFLFQVPRRILLNPGKRRTMMRRAMRGIVPSEVIERRRKAFIARRPLASIQMHRERLQALFATSRLADYGLVKADELRSALETVANGQDTSRVSLLMKSISLELWLRSEPTALRG